MQLFFCVSHTRNTSAVSAKSTMVYPKNAYN